MNNRTIKQLTACLPPLAKALALCGVIGWVVCGLSLFSACREDQDDSFVAERAGMASLHFTLGVPDKSASTRSVSSDPKNADNKWSDWERLVDGRYLYRVTLLLVDADNKLAGSWDWNEASSTTTTEVSTTISGLTAGATYTLYAVANYSAITVGGNTYSGLTSFPTLTGHAVGDNVFSLVSSLKEYKIDAGTDFIAPQQPQPLTLVQTVTLPASGGSYEVEGELVRTYARLRIEVANKSDNNPLKINSLTFNTDFAQQQAYLLNDPTDPDRNFTSMTTGKPTVTADDALTKFAAQEIEEQSSAVVFDGYILESRNGSEGYIYTLNVEYEGESYIIEVTTWEKTNDIYTSVGDLKSNSHNDNYFLIENIRSSKYMVVVGEQVCQQDYYNTDLSGVQELIWQLIPYNGTDITDSYIHNVGKKTYIGGTPYLSSVFSVAEVKSVYFNFSDCQNITYGGIQMNESGNNLYMNDLNGQYICSYYGNDPGNGFRFYALEKHVTQTVREAKYSDQITLKTIDATSGVATPVTQISRNDFINVLVNVAYNKSTGTMQFCVEDWTQVNNEIEFE